MAHVTSRPQVVSVQTNVNDRVKDNGWEHINNLIGYETMTYASSTFNFNIKNGKIVSKKKPAPLSIRNFDLDIPLDSKITYLSFIVRMKATKADCIDAPRVKFSLRDSEYKSQINADNTGQSGWTNGYYYAYLDKKVSTSYHNYEYKMDMAEYNKAKYSVNDLLSDYAGIDLEFLDAEHTSTIYVTNVSMVVYYEKPEYSVTFSSKATQHAPYKPPIHKEFKFRANFKSNGNITNAASKSYVVEIPFGTFVSEASVRGGTWTHIRDNQYRWKINANSGSLILTLFTYVTGLNTITFTPYENSGLSYKEWFYSPQSSIPADFGVFYVTHEGAVHKNHDVRFDVKTRVFTTDGTFRVYMGTENGTVVEDFTLNGEESTAGVEIDAVGSNYVNFTIPDGITEADISFSRTYSYNTEGSNFVAVHNPDFPEDGVTHTFTVQPPYEYIARINPQNDIFDEHRIITVSETNATVLDCSFKERDRTMSISRASLKLHYWEKVAYLGFIPIQHAHYKPKSTYKDTLLNETYKNKSYMGKKGVIDEDITLQLKLRPYQVTDVQGMIAMDKPIPLDLVPTAFDGDSLNHRGWAEIYSIKAEKTNPLYYDSDIDVKYLTHNINSRFMITKGKKSSAWNIPSLMVEKQSSGEEITKLFTVKTDGTYIYDEEADEDRRTSIALDNGQSLYFKTKEKLSSRSNIVQSWVSTELEEASENNISRVVRLIDDATNEVVFEYIYQDYELDSDYISCTALGLLRDDDDWEQVFADQIDFIVEGGNASSAVLSEEEGENYINIDEDKHYGSTLHFELNGNTLDIVDEGFTGKDVVQTVELEGEKYRYEVEWRNNNEDADSEDIITFFDIVVEETLLTATVEAKQYSKMYISPFPVANKTLLFTRECEDGTIFYYSDDGKKFSYKMDPYYQYHTGVDMKTDAGVSLWNLENNHTVFYVDNGLVRLGFNRGNGEVSLAKYDALARVWVTVTNFKIYDCHTFKMGEFSDDKIEIIVNKSKFTIWRGHPYVMVNHKDEPIYIRDKVYKVWSEGLNNEMLEYPAYWDLMNTDNKLSAKAGGVATLDSSVMTVNEIDDPLTPTTTSLVIKKGSTTVNNINEGDTVKFVVTTTGTGEIAYMVNGVCVGYGSTEDSSPFTHTFTKGGTHKVQAIFVANEPLDASFSKVVTLNVKTDVTVEGENSSYKLKMLNAVTSVEYMDEHNFTFQLTKDGVPVPNRTVEMNLPVGIDRDETDAQGRVTFTNNSQLFTVGKWKIGAKYITSNEPPRVVQKYYNISIVKSDYKLYLAEPERVNDYLKVKVMHKNGVAIANKQVMVFANKKPHRLITNSNGYVVLKITNKGHYIFKIVVGSDENHKQTTARVESQVS